MTKLKKSYDHRKHAGNAGDVWKHFLLAEVAGFILARDRNLVYAESHAGFPEYLLEVPGEWIEGIGRCQAFFPSLRNFLFFQILSQLNPLQLRIYPGSSRLILEAAARFDGKIKAYIWDIDPKVDLSWKKWNGSGKPQFHLRDGFAGVNALLDKTPPGLLLIDPPYIDEKDAHLAEKLLYKAEEKGWLVLWWYMAEQKTLPGNSHAEVFMLEFSQAGMDCGRWKSAVVALAGADESLIEYLHCQRSTLLQIMKKF